MRFVSVDIIRFEILKQKFDLIESASLKTIYKVTKILMYMQLFANYLYLSNG